MRAGNPPFKHGFRSVALPVHLLIHNELNDYQFIDAPSRWAIHTIEPLDSYIADGIALVGDAVSHRDYSSRNGH